MIQFETISYAQMRNDGQLTGGIHTILSSTETTKRYLLNSDVCQLNLAWFKTNPCEIEAFAILAHGMLSYVSAEPLWD